MAALSDETICVVVVVVVDVDVFQRTCHLTFFHLLLALAICYFRACCQRNEELEAKAAAKEADGSGADVDDGGAGSVVAAVAAGGTSSAAESRVCGLEKAPVCWRFFEVAAARRSSDSIDFGT